MKTFNQMMVEVFDIQEGNPLGRTRQLAKQGRAMMIITAHHRDNTPEQNKSAMDRLKAKITASGHTGGYHNNHAGTWKNEHGNLEQEKSLTVHASATGTAGTHTLERLGHRLRKEYNQDSFIVAHPHPDGHYEGVLHGDGWSSPIGKIHYNQDNPMGVTHMKKGKSFTFKGKELP